MKNYRIDKPGYDDSVRWIVDNETKCFIEIVIDEVEVEDLMYFEDTVSTESNEWAPTYVKYSSDVTIFEADSLEDIKQFLITEFFVASL